MLRGRPSGSIHFTRYHESAFNFGSMHDNTRHFCPTKCHENYPILKCRIKKHLFSGFNLCLLFGKKKKIKTVNLHYDGMVSGKSKSSYDNKVYSEI